MFVGWIIIHTNKRAETKPELKLPRQHFLSSKHLIVWPYLTFLFNLKLKFPMFWKCILEKIPTTVPQYWFSHGLEPLYQQYRPLPFWANRVSEKARSRLLSSVWTRSRDIWDTLRMDFTGIWQKKKNRLKCWGLFSGFRRECALRDEHFFAYSAPCPRPLNPITGFLSSPIPLHAPSSWSRSPLHRLSISIPFFLGE